MDGVLVSKMALIQNEAKYRRVLERGIRRALRIPPYLEVMGDCGAWGYIDQEEPMLIEQILVAISISERNWSLAGISARARTPSRCARPARSPPPAFCRRCRVLAQKLYITPPDANFRPDEHRGKPASEPPNRGAAGWLRESRGMHLRVSIRKGCPERTPFKVGDVLRYYVKCGFDYGVSVDHLIVPAYEDQKEKRWKITLENAREMFELWESKDEYFEKIEIIGVARGWDVPSYRRAVRELLEIWYDYIGIGVVARALSFGN